MTTELDPTMRQDYQRALGRLRERQDPARRGDQPEDVSAVTKTLEDGLYAQACGGPAGR